MTTYSDFIADKSKTLASSGFDPETIARLDHILLENEKASES